MPFIDWPGYFVTMLGFFGFFIGLRRLLPYYVIRNVSSNLNNAEQYLSHAMATGAISEMSDYRVDLEILASRFAQMRIESNRSPGLFPQIWLAIRHGLTCKLSFLGKQIGAVRQKLEMAMDEQRLALLAPLQIDSDAPLPVPAGDVAIPMTNTTEPTYPPTISAN